MYSFSTFILTVLIFTKAHLTKNMPRWVVGLVALGVGFVCGGVAWWVVLPRVVRTMPSAKGKVGELELGGGV